MLNLLFPRESADRPVIERHVVGAFGSIRIGSTGVVEVPTDI